MSEQLVDLVTAGGAGEARVIQAVLRAAGIPAIVEGEALMDEWAVSQRMMGQIGSVVRVPASAVEAARAVLDEAREAGAFDSDALDSGAPVEEGSEDDPRAPSERSAREEDRLIDEANRARGWPASAFVVCAVLLVATIVCAVRWVDEKVENDRILSDRLLEFEWNEHETELHVRLRRTGEPIAVHEDQDYDGIWERLRSLTPDGKTTWDAFDEDEDGRAERTVLLSPRTGRELCEWIDADGDGFPERVMFVTADGVRTVFEDTDGDYEYDTPR